MSKETEGTQDANQPRDGGAGLAPPPEMAAIDAMVAGAEEKAARASAPEPSEKAPDAPRSSQPSIPEDDESQRIGAAVLPDAGASRRARARMTLKIPDDSVPINRAGSSPDLSSSIRMPSSPDLGAAVDPASVIRAMRIISVGEQGGSRSAMELSPAPDAVSERIPSSPSMSAPTPIAPPSAMIPGGLDPQGRTAPPETSEEALTPDDILGESDVAPIPPPVVAGPPLVGPPLDYPRYVPPPPVSGTHPIPTRVQISEAEPTPAPRARMEAVIEHADEVELSDEEIAPDSEKSSTSRLKVQPPPPPPSVPPAAPGATPSPLPVIAVPPVPGAMSPIPGAQPLSAMTQASPADTDDGAVTRQMAVVRMPSTPQIGDNRSPFPSVDVPVELSEEPVEEAPPPSQIPTPIPPAAAGLTPLSGISAEKSQPAMQVPPPPPLGIKAEKSQPAMQVPPPPPLGIKAEKSQPAMQVPPPPPLGIKAEKSQPAMQVPPPPPLGVVAPVKSEPSIMGPPIAPPIGLTPPPAPIARVPSQPSAVIPPAQPPAAAEPVRRSSPDAVEVSDAELESVEEGKKEPKRVAPPPAPKPKQRPPAAETPAPPPVTAAPPPAETPSQRPKGRPWWEELFTDDFARSMDRLTPQQIAKEARFIEESLALQKGGVMLDLGCGNGQHAVELASRGYNVVGYDLSLTMLASAADEAQTRGQKLNLLQGDMREMAFEEMFDGVYSWATSFGYFDLEKNVDVIRRVHRSLRSGGMFLLDIVNRDYIVSRLPSLAWFEGDGCVCMDDAKLDSITSRLVVKRTLMLDDGRAREIEYSIRLYALHEIGKILNETGFKVVEVSGHPAMNGVFMGAESPRLITLAEKR